MCDIFDITTHICRKYVSIMSKIYLKKIPNCVKRGAPPFGDAAYAFEELVPDSVRPGISVFETRDQKPSPLTALDAEASALMRTRIDDQGSQIAKSIQHRPRQILTRGAAPAASPV